MGGKETISENRLRTKSGLIRPRGISTSGNPAAQDRLWEVRSRLPRRGSCHSFWPSLPHSLAASSPPRTASRKQKAPIDSWGVGWCQWQGLVADGKFFSLKSGK